jgi:hypothetical protein
MSCSAHSASQRLRAAIAVPQLREGGLQRFDRSLVAVDHGGVDIEGCGNPARHRSQNQPIRHFSPRESLREVDVTDEAPI